MGKKRKMSECLSPVVQMHNEGIAAIAALPPLAPVSEVVPVAPKRAAIQPRILIQNISFQCDRPEDILSMCEQVARFLTTGTHVTIVTEDGKVGWEARVDREGWLSYES